MLGKIGRQAGKDHLVHPLLSVPSFLPTLLANVTANDVRNIWLHSVIMCGHFPEGVETFEKHSIDGKTRGEWYLRQMLGSADISGSRLFHILTGNLSHPIEQHHTAPLPRQVASAWHKVLRLSLPNGWLVQTTPRNLPAQLVKLVRMTIGGPAVCAAALQA